MLIEGGGARKYWTDDHNDIPCAYRMTKVYILDFEFWETRIPKMFKRDVEHYHMMLEG